MFKKSAVFSLQFAPSLHFTLSLQSTFYTQSAFYPWSIRSLQSAVRSLSFTLTDCFNVVACFDLDANTNY